MTGVILYLNLHCKYFGMVDIEFKPILLHFAAVYWIYCIIKDLISSTQLICVINLKNCVSSNVVHIQAAKNRKHVEYILYYNNPTRCSCAQSVLFHCSVTLHVSGAFRTYHQEYFNCIYNLRYTSYCKVQKYLTIWQTI